MLDPEQPVLKPLPPGMRGDDIGGAAEVAAGGKELPGVGLRLGADRLGPRTSGGRCR